MLDVTGFNVFEFGIDVPVDMFVEKAREFQPQVVGLSGFLTLAFDSMKKTVEALEQAGLRDKVKIMIGGGQVDEEVRSIYRADAYGIGCHGRCQIGQNGLEGTNEQFPNSSIRRGRRGSTTP